MAARVGLHVAADRPLGTLSGGQAARACLVAVLLSQYDVLLLDEPTNDLDARGLTLMADFVRSHEGPILIASHDRTFLDAVATSVVELDLNQQRIGHYTGGWSEFVDAARARPRATRGRPTRGMPPSATRCSRSPGSATTGPTRVGATSRWARSPTSTSARSTRPAADRQAAKGARLERAAERLDAVEQPRKEWQLRYAITEGRPSADVVATLSDAVVERHGFRLGPVSLVVGRGDRIAVVGDNGAGKTTLLGALLGDLPLASGRQSLGTRVAVGRHRPAASLLDDDATVLDVVRRELGPDPKTAREWPVADVRTLLAKFGLGSDHVARPARSLSMGERTRALMALFQGREVNVLVLDEPTNHLDVDAIEQLEAAVAAFGGTRARRQPRREPAATAYA